MGEAKRTNRTWSALAGMALLLNAAMALAAETKTKTAAPAVMVYVRQDNLTVAELGRAEQRAAQLFASIGVPLLFRAGAEHKSRGESTVSIELQLHARTAPGFHPGAMAYAMPFGASGTRIHIFCDRVRNTSPDGGTGTILGYVLGHEIAHVLQGVTRHSDDGVLKAHWETTDYRQMKSGTLSFDPADAELIRAALENRKALQSARAVPLPH